MSLPSPGRTASHAFAALSIAACPSPTPPKPTDTRRGYWANHERRIKRHYLEENLAADAVYHSDANLPQMASALEKVGVGKIRCPLALRLLVGHSFGFWHDSTT